VSLGADFAMDYRQWAGAETQAGRGISMSDFRIFGEEGKVHFAKCPPQLKRDKYAVGDVTPAMFLENRAGVMCYLGHDWVSQTLVLVKCFDLAHMSATVRVLLRSFAIEVASFTHTNLLDHWMAFQEGSLVVFFLDPNIGVPLSSWMTSNEASVSEYDILKYITAPLFKLLRDLHNIGLVYGPFSIKDVRVLESGKGKAPMLKLGCEAMPLRLMPVILGTSPSMHERSLRDSTDGLKARARRGQVVPQVAPGALGKTVVTAMGEEMDMKEVLESISLRDMNAALAFLPLPPPEMLSLPRKSGGMLDTWCAGIVTGSAFGVASLRTWTNESGNSRGSFTLPKVLSWEAKDLVATMLHSDIRSRPVPADLLEHPAFDIIRPRSLAERALPCLGRAPRRDPEERWPVVVNIMITRTFKKDGLHKVWSTILRPVAGTLEVRTGLDSAAFSEGQSHASGRQASGDAAKLRGPSSSCGSQPDWKSVAGPKDGNRTSDGPGRRHRQSGVDSVASLLSVISAFPMTPAARAAARALLEAGAEGRLAGTTSGFMGYPGAHPGPKGQGGPPVSKDTATAMGRRVSGIDVPSRLGGTASRLGGARGSFTRGANTEKQATAPQTAVPAPGPDIPPAQTPHTVSSGAPI